MSKSFLNFDKNRDATFILAYFNCLTQKEIAGTRVPPKRDTRISASVSAEPLLGTLCRREHNERGALAKMAFPPI